MVNLRELNLFNCNLKVLPEEIGKLTSLKELLLNGNELEALPSQISLLTNLEGYLNLL